MFEIGVEMPGAYSTSICDPDYTVETHTEFVADGQTAISEFRVSMWIFTYTQTCSEQLFVLVSPWKNGKTGHPMSAAPGHHHCFPRSSF